MVRGTVHCRCTLKHTNILMDTITSEHAHTHIHTYTHTHADYTVSTVGSKPDTKLKADQGVGTSPICPIVSTT
jgi:hypothetical protein